MELYITCGEARGEERNRSILRDLVERRDVGDMDSFKSHRIVLFCFDLIEVEREKEREGFSGYFENCRGGGSLVVVFNMGFLGEEVQTERDLQGNIRSPLVICRWIFSLLSTTFCSLSPFCFFQSTVYF